MINLHDSTHYSPLNTFQIKTSLKFISIQQENQNLNFLTHPPCLFIQNKFIYLWILK